MKRVLVTGGAGFIGSHTVDRLLEKGYEVRILDNLEPPTHLAGKPPWVPAEAEFQRGDVRQPDDLARALRGVQGVIHLAATGGFTPDLVRYFETNSIGTANLLELLQRPRSTVEKIVVASSVGIYGEGKYECARCGVRTPPCRDLEQLERHAWEPLCPDCGAELSPLPIDEDKVPYPQNAYSISKFDQERLVLSFGRSQGLPAVALRYFLTYGPRQSLTNPYTGVISIFSSRILNGLPPVLFEDGRQLRDFVYVEDVARANVAALELEETAPTVMNVGTGAGTRIADVAATLSQLLDEPDCKPEVPNAYRPGEARHVVADPSRARARGLLEEPRPLREGLERYLAWVREAGDVREYFSSAMQGLRRSGVVRGQGAGETGPAPGSLTVVFLAYNEAGNLEGVVRRALHETGKLLDDFEILIVDDGSRDGTDAIADRLAGEDERVRVVHHPFNVGYGGAQKSGIQHATKEWLVIAPADDQFDPQDLSKFLAAREGVDIVGSTRIGRKDPWQRRLVSRVYNWYMSRYELGLPDLNWVKMYRRSVLEGLPLENRGFGFDAELVVKAKARGARITAVPVEHRPRSADESTAGVNVRNIWKTMRELARLPDLLRRMEEAESASGRSGER